MKNHNLRYILLFTIFIVVIYIISMTTDFATKLFEITSEKIIYSDFHSKDFGNNILAGLFHEFFFIIMLGVAYLSIIIFIYIIVTLIQYLITKLHSKCNAGLFLSLYLAPFVLCLILVNVTFLRIISFKIINITFLLLSFILFISSITNYFLVFRNKKKVTS